MRIHHLNCVSSCPLGGVLLEGIPRDSLRGRLTNHCLLVETKNGLVLVDTGFGLRDVADPRSRLSPFFLSLLKPELRASMTAFCQVKALGFDPIDVRHIVLSHLDFDHAGGLDDFPNARVHVLAEEVAAATAQRTLLDRMRYRPQQWNTMRNWTAYNAEGEPWLGFQAVRGLTGLDDEILLVPLGGHTLGHAGIAVRRTTDWLFYAGDAYFFHGEMDKVPHCPPGLRQYQRLMDKNGALRLENQRRLRALSESHRSEVEIICAHDVTEFERVSHRSHRDPVGVGMMLEGRRPLQPPHAPEVPSFGSRPGHTTA